MSWIFVGAGENVGAAGDGAFALGAHRRCVALNEAGFQRRPNAAGLLDLAEGRPRRGAERVCHGFQRAGAGGRIADAGEVRFFQEHKLGIARDAAGERVGQTQRRGVRQHRDGIGAAQARGGDRDRGAQHVHVRIALGHHAPGGLGRDHGRLRRQSAGLLDARPQFPRGAEFRHGQKLIGVCRQPEIDRVARFSERHAVGFERAQVSDRARQRKGQFLRFGAAGIMDDAAIGDGERTAEAGGGKLADHRGKGWRKFFPASRPAAGNGKAADRIDAGAQIDLCRRDAAAFDQRGEIADHVPRRRRKIEIDRHGGEIDAVERALKRRRRRIEAESVGAHRAGEHQHQAGRAVLQIVERLRIGGRRVGMIDALHDGPGRAGRTPAKRGRRGVARIKRLDGQAVMGPAFEPRERRALEHGIDQAAPGFFRCRGEIRGRVLWVRHRCKVPCRQWLATGRPTSPAVQLACRVLTPGQLLDARHIHALERVADPDARDDAVGGDLGQRHENEGALEQVRVGQRQGGVVEDKIVISQDVEIDGPRSPVLFFGAVAAKGAFAGLGAG